MAKLKLNRGTTYIRTITYLKDGVVTPVTGMTVYFTVKDVEYDSNAADEGAIIAKTMEGLSGDLAAEGKFEIVISPHETALVEPGDYHYDVKICENPSEGINQRYIYKLEEGTLVLDGSPTNRAT